MTNGSRLWHRVDMRAWCACLLLLGCDGGPTGGEDAGRDAMTGPAPPHATISWRMRCGSGTCPTEEPPERIIDADDGEDGHTIACDLTFADGQRRFELTARRGNEYGIDVGGGAVASTGDRLMGSLCRMRVFEEADDTIYASCGSNLPTADVPCQFQRIDIEDGADGQALVAELRCVDAPIEDDLTNLRDVTSPSAPSGYAELRFTGCVGLE
jgi:hypothetical protein